MMHEILRKCSFASVTIGVSAFLLVAAISVFVFKQISGADIDSYDKYGLTDVVCDFEKLDVGNVPSDTIVMLDYKVKNTGTDSLHVLFVSPDCNCTGFHLSKQSAEVGDSIILSLEVDMKNKRKGRFMLNTVVGLNTKQRLYRVSVEGTVL